MAMMSTEKLVPSLSQSVIDSLHDKSISSLKKFEMVQKYFAQAPSSPDPNDAYAVSVLLEEQLEARDMSSAIAMVELMNKHNVPAESRTVSLFNRLFARLLAEDPTKMQDRVLWYANHHQALTSPLPVDELFVELVSRGYVSVAVSLWELCMEDPILSSCVPRLASVDALVSQLVRYEQVDAVVALTTSKYQDQLWASPSPVFVTKVMEGHSDRREFHEVVKVHDMLTAKGIVVDTKRYKILVRNAKVHLELRTGTSFLAPE